MDKKQRAQYVLRTLRRLYPKPKPPLKHKDNYTLLIAVLLSARCTDKKVNEVTPHLFSMADTPEEMVKLSVAKVRSIIKPCGLSPQKSKAICKLSKILIQKHKGCVPCSFEDLEKLPGVGHKTASVVMSQAFKVPAFPVDTHIHRLARRWKLTGGKSVVQTERDLKALFHKKYWRDLHLQIIFYGRNHCTSHGCDGTQCLICSYFARKG